MFLAGPKARARRVSRLEFVGSSGGVKHKSGQRLQPGDVDSRGCPEGREVRHAPLTEGGLPTLVERRSTSAAYLQNHIARVSLDYLILNMARVSE